MLRKISILLSAISFATARPSFAGKPRDVSCGAAAGGCFSKAVEPMNGLSIALAIPSEPKGAGVLGNDFLMNMTVALPYGFSALQGDTMEDTSQKQFNIAIFMGGAATGDIAGASAYFWFALAQYNQVEPGQNIAVSAPGVAIDGSQLTSWDANTASVVIRCRNCTLTGVKKDGRVHLQAILSQAQPSVSLSEGEGTLPLDGQVVVPFTLDLSDIQRDDYDDLVTQLLIK
ncbi:hypothetical protein PHLGIDRAFT_466411 [Phlebiopsis gigantea 11061_1 CR5-6]|uniref:Cellobiose dehydrogenase cytochrome domain-containing protein n=1 Tax=Phlebiopsis gigantea (strain 11061_1 CR5-6) TaxID=745531 RepID=A0A0C3PJD9_PHLG1|nr:hypothetical protein PHLGIDRAFT_466411 [Phlebiopsis gigantea 11061_1 CR5-6]